MQSSPNKQKRGYTPRVASPPKYPKIEVTPELQKLKEMAKNKESLDCATSEQIENLLSILNQEKKILAKHRLFNEATICSNMIEYVSKYRDSIIKKENQKVAKKEFAVVRKQFDDSFKEFDEETKILEKKLILNQKNRLETLKKEQEEELKEFESRWNSEKKLRIYNKGGDDLNTMKSRIPFLLADNQFEEAKATEKDIENKTNEEVFDHHYNMQLDYDRALKHLIKKQDHQMEQFNNDCDVELLKFKQDRKILRQGFLNRQLKLKTKENIIDDPDKLWVHSQNKRLTNTTNNILHNPSSKMAVNDFRSHNMSTLPLPPLKKHLPPMKKKISSN